MPGIVAFIEELVARGQCLRRRRRRLLPRRELPGVRPAVGPASRSGRAGRGAERAEGGPARLRALEGQQARDRGHVVGLALGPRPAGLAHRVLRDGRGDLRPGVRDPRRRPRSRLPPPRERGGAVARARSSLRQDLGAQRDAAFHRREDVEVGRQRRDDPRDARRVGPRGGARLLPHRVTGASRSTSRPRRWPRPWRGATRCATRSRLPVAEHDESGWAPFAAALDDDFDTPAALAVLHDWASAGQLELLRRGLAIFGLESLADRDEAPPDVAELAERRAAARAERDFEASDRLRDELAGRGWEMRDEPGGGYTLVRRGG